MATKTYAKAIVDGVSDLSAPHAFFGVTSALFGDLIMNGGANFLDSRA